MSQKGAWFAAVGCAASLVLAAGCGSEEGGDDDVTGDPVDLRVPVPDPDPAYIDLVTPEVVIESGEEKMFCIYLDNLDGELAVSEMESYQGNYGHHMVLLTTTEPEEHGTFVDCSDSADMYKYRAFILPGTPLPDGHGILIPDGTQYVLQFHYVNASPDPILVRDVARLEKMAVEDVTTWVTTLTTNSLRLEVPADLPAQEQFDCTVQEDVDLLLIGGHLHEQGEKFEVLVGDDVNSLSSIYLVDPWREEYRDAPPVNLFFQNPMPLPAGKLIRTNCSWRNTLQAPLEFPAEMCATFGYIAGTQTPLHCEAE
jgi:hypothetical protein